MKIVSKFARLSLAQAFRRALVDVQYYRRRLLAAVTLSIVATVSTASAALISSFSFNQLTAGGGQASPIYADTATTAGGNTAAYLVNQSFSTTGFTSTTGTTSNSNAANPNSLLAGRGLALASEGTTNNNSDIRFHLSTRGYTDVTFSFATARLVSTAFNTQTLYFYTNGGSQTSLGSYNPPKSGAVTAISFGGASALNNVADLII